MLLASIEQAKFRRPVLPGDQLRIEMKVTKRKASIAKMHGQATVDGVVVAEAELMCELADRQPLIAGARSKSRSRSPKPAHGDSSDRNRRPASPDRRKRRNRAVLHHRRRMSRIGARTRLMAHVYRGRRHATSAKTISSIRTPPSAWRRRI